jgi:hypothetical protein
VVGVPGGVRFQKGQTRLAGRDALNRARSAHVIVSHLFPRLHPPVRSILAVHGPRTLAGGSAVSLGAQ